MSITSIAPQASSEIAALAQTTASSRATASSSTAVVSAGRAVDVPGPSASVYANNDKSSASAGVTLPAPPYAGKIDYMTDAEIWDTARRMRLEDRKYDYTGMSDVEIYQAICDRYVEVFGEPFLNMDEPLIASLERGAAVSVFHAALRDQFGTSRAADLVNRERLGCAGMNYAEAERTVIQKYADKTPLTLRDVVNINVEMCNMGYLNGSMAALQKYVMPASDTGDMNKINAFFDQPFNMADAKSVLDEIFGYSDPTTKQMITNLYSMFSSLIKFGLYDADDELLNALADHLTKHPATDTIELP